MESAFFSQLDISYKPSVFVSELIHESTDGWSQLYLIDKDGKFRVYKALKPQYRGVMQYEILLKKEYEIGYRLSHNHICEVFGFIHSEDLGNCIEMEWVDGETLSSFLLREHPSLELSKRILSQICDAIEYCHSKQVIHRDIKLDNIMLTHNGHSVKLIDFGLSDSDSYSMLKSPCGTKSFVAPEIIQGHRADIQTDIFSLGKVISSFPGPFRRLSEKCTRVNPARRFSDVSQVRSALLRAGHHTTTFVASGLVIIVALVWSLAFFLQGRTEVHSNQVDVAAHLEPSNQDVSVEQSEFNEPSELSTNYSVPSIAKPASNNDDRPSSQDEVISGRKSVQYDTLAIDELFNMATDLMNSD